jgi:menaquinone-dependent protoporphyrinogen IX oxidase
MATPISETVKYLYGLHKDRGRGNMSKAIVIYDSKYGNTRLAAERIAEIMRDRGGAEASIVFLEEVDVSQLPSLDIIVMGSPNHWGRLTKKFKKMIPKLQDVDLSGKKIALFDTCFEPEKGKATRSMEKRIVKVAPNVSFLAPHLSIVVDSAKGPIAQGEMTKVDEYAERIASESTT